MPDYRIYFNRKAEFPQVWSFDEGDQTSEVNIVDFKCHDITMVEPGADFAVKVNPDTPTVWINVRRATVQMRAGVAHFFRDTNWRVPRIDVRTPEQIYADNERETDARLGELP